MIAEAVPARGAAAASAPRPARRFASSTSSRRRPSGSRPASRSSTGCSAAGSCRRRSCSSAASRASASRRCSYARSARSRRDRRALLVTGEESVAQVKLRAARLGGCDGVEILAETELDAVCETLERERPAVCVIDSVQTLWSQEIGSAPGLGLAGARGGGAAAAGREGERRRDVPRRPRDEGRLGRRPARARASRRLRAAVRGRPLPRPSHPAGGQEPVRLDERARRLRDDRRGPRRRARSRPSSSAHTHAGEIGAAVACTLEGHAAAPARDPGARRAHRPRDAPPGRHRRRPEATRDDRRRARAPRRPAARRRPTSSSTSPGACASTSPAPTSGSRSRSPRRRRACRSARAGRLRRDRADRPAPGCHAGRPAGRGVPEARLATSRRSARGAEFEARPSARRSLPGSARILG